MPSKSLWLGQPTDARILLNAGLRDGPWNTLLSLGDVVRKPHLERKFSKNLRGELGICGPVMIDSGGFTIAQRDALEWNVQRVIEVYRRLRADILVPLDFPPAKGDRKVQRIKKIQKTYKSYKYMLDFFEDDLMPVIHGREDEEIELSCHLTASTCRSPKFVALGGVVPLLQQSSKRSQNMEFIQRSILTIRRFFPHSAVHVFGAGSPKTISRIFDFGASSVDSVAWRQAAAFGSVYLLGGSQRLLPGSNQMNKSRPILNDAELGELQNCRCPMCRDTAAEIQLENLLASFQSRAIHNAWTVRESVTPTHP